MSDPSTGSSQAVFTRSLTSALVWCFCYVSYAHAETIKLRINNRSDSDAAGYCTEPSKPCTLRAAFRMADEDPENRYEATLEAQGTYATTSTLRLTAGSLALLSGFERLDQVMLDAGGHHRLVDVSPRDGERADLRLRGLIARGGYEANYGGGGIAIRERARVSLERVIVEENQSTGFGAGIYVAGGSLTMKESVVRANSNASDDCGGGFFRSGGGLSVNYNGSASIDRSTIEDNRACRGAGVLVSGARITMTNTTIANNLAETRGGGMLIAYDVTVFMRFNTVANNQAGVGDGADHLNYGGGLALQNVRGSLFLSGNLIAGNEFVGRHSFPKDENQNAYPGHDCILDDTVLAAADDNSVPENAATVDTSGNLFGTLGYRVDRGSVGALVQIPGGRQRSISTCGMLADRSFAGRDDLRLDPDVEDMYLGDGAVPFVPPFLQPRSVQWASDAFRASSQMPRHVCMTTDLRGYRRPLVSAGQCDIGAFETGGLAP